MSSPSDNDQINDQINPPTQVTQGTAEGDSNLQCQKESTHTFVDDKDPQKLRGKTEWKGLGFRVPTKSKPQKTEKYLVPGYRQVYRERYLYSLDQVVPIDPDEAKRRSSAAQKAVETRIDNMERAAENVELTIKSGCTNREIYDIAFSSHGGNYQGEVGEFHWSNKAARNAIRHCLTNYEKCWSLINRGDLAKVAYFILRMRVDELVDEAYPQFAKGMPEIPHPEPEN